MPISGGIKTKNQKSLKGSGWFDGNNQPNMSNQNGYTLNSINPFASNPNGANQNSSMFSSLGNMFSSGQGNKNQQYGTLNFGNSNNPNMYGGKGPSAVAATSGYNPFAASSGWGSQKGGWEVQNQPSYGAQTRPYGMQNQPYGAQTRTYGMQNQMNGMQNQMNGSQTQPYGMANQPYGSQTQPYGMSNQMNGNQINGNQMNGNQMNGNQMNGNQMNGNQMNGNQMNGMQNQNSNSFWTWGGKRRKGTKKMRGGYTNNIPLTGLASSAAPINDIRSAQPQQMVGGRTRRRRRRSCCCKNKHSKSCKNYKK